MNKHSYATSSKQLLLKILKDIELMKSIKDHKRILLRHLHLCLTNKCVLNCKYCVCKDRDKKAELEIGAVRDLLGGVSRQGCKAITLTGGGEPLMYENIQAVIDECLDLGIRVGLVTNGMLLDKMPQSVAWCRISFDSYRKLDDIVGDPKEKITLEEKIIEAVKLSPHTAWSFSFVLTEKLGDLKKVVEFANQNNFTHVKVVGDALNPSDEIIERGKEELKGIDDKVIYEPRTKTERGSKKCYVSLLKPTVSADGKIYPCCSFQCAIMNKRGDFPEEHNMGEYWELEKVSYKRKYFDGSVCDRCPYSHYNELLGKLLQDVKDEEFV